MCTHTEWSFEFDPKQYPDCLRVDTNSLRSPLQPSCSSPWARTPPRTQSRNETLAQGYDSTTLEQPWANVPSQQTQDVESTLVQQCRRWTNVNPTLIVELMSVYRWSNVVDGGPTLNQHLVSAGILFLLGFINSTTYLLLGVFLCVCYF